MKPSFAAVLDRIGNPPPDAEARNQEILAARARVDEAAEHDRRASNWRAFIGDRRQYASCSLDGWKFDPAYKSQQAKIVNGVADYIAGLPTNAKAGVNVLFYGPPGTGKDFLATCIIREAIQRHGHTAAFINGIDLFLKLRGTFGDESRRNESDVIHEAIRPQWSVLSDPLPPVGNLTDYQAAMLYRLMDERSSQLKPTIVTVNVENGDEAMKRMGAPTWDRIKHGAWTFACNWPSYRKPARVVL
jgi:DNA replication protein DnaC